MNAITTRRHILRAGLALGATALVPPVRACEFFASTLRITHPWTRVTPADARFAVVCMKIDQVTREDRLIGVVTPVATGAEIGGISTGRALDLLIEKGRELQLTEAGVHLRLTGLTQPLLIGRAYPMRLIFEKGGVLEAELNVDYEMS
ncbi:copper chaperone PCu(A)C [Aquabacterium sp. NJ1]|uniref:copper chaperone PCu(A)C n=1 Tax=Aquabacterium sp. NJ1 TaxID=1538295 RepID=UPI00068BEDCD|nr:copper chaperone PCu(A)C [Aquabacterium sp. NJ1]